MCSWTFPIATRYCGSSFSIQNLHSLPSIIEYMVGILVVVVGPVRAESVVVWHRDTQYTQRLLATSLGEELHKYFDPCLFYDDEELRKSVELPPSPSCPRSNGAVRPA